MHKTRAALALSLAALALGACETHRSVTVRNETNKKVNVRIVHDSFLGGERNLANLTLQPGVERTLGPYDVPGLDPITLEAMFSDAVADFPQTYRIDEPNTRLVFTRGGMESWTGLVISREDAAEVEDKTAKAD